MKSWLKRFASAVELSVSLPSAHPPTYRLCSFQLAARPRLPFGCYEITEITPAAVLGIPPRSLPSLSSCVAYKIPGLFGHLSLSLSQPSPASPSLSLKFLRLLLPWNSNNLRDEGSFSMCLPDSPNFRGLSQRRVLEISNARLSFSLKSYL